MWCGSWSDVDADGNISCSDYPNQRCSHCCDRFCRTCLFDNVASNGEFVCPRCGKQSFSHTSGSISQWTPNRAHGPESADSSVRRTAAPATAGSSGPLVAPYLNAMTGGFITPQQICVLFDLNLTLVFRNEVAIQGAACPSTELSLKGRWRHMHHRLGCAQLFQFVLRWQMGSSCFVSP